MFWFNRSHIVSHVFFMIIRGLLLSKIWFYEIVLFVEKRITIKIWRLANCPNLPFVAYFPFWFIDVVNSKLIGVLVILESRLKSINETRFVCQNKFTLTGIVNSLRFRTIIHIKIWIDKFFCFIIGLKPIQWCKFFYFLSEYMGI